MKWWAWLTRVGGEGEQDESERGFMGEGVGLWVLEEVDIARLGSATVYYWSAS